MSVLRYASVALLAGCGTPPREEEPPPVVWNGPMRTDRSAYVAQRERRIGAPPSYAFTVVASYTNRGAQPVYLGRCFPDSPQPIYGVPLVGAKEPLSSAYDPGWSCVGHDRLLVVPPGHTRVDTLRITGPGAWDGETGEIIGTLEGRFRLMYQAQSCPGEGDCPLPDSLRHSNEFEVRIGR